MTANGTVPLTKLLASFIATGGGCWDPSVPTLSWLDGRMVDNDAVVFGDEDVSGFAYK